MLRQQKYMKLFFMFTHHVGCQISSFIHMSVSTACRWNLFCNSDLHWYLSRTDPTWDLALWKWIEIWLLWLRTTNPLIRMDSLASTVFSPWPTSSNTTLSPSDRLTFITWQKTKKWFNHLSIISKHNNKRSRFWDLESFSSWLKISTEILYYAYCGYSTWHFPISKNTECHWKIGGSTSCILWRILQAIKWHSKLHPLKRIVRKHRKKNVVVRTARHELTSWPFGGILAVNLGGRKGTQRIKCPWNRNKHFIQQTGIHQN